MHAVLIEAGGYHILPMKDCNQHGGVAGPAATTLLKERQASKGGGRQAGGSLQPSSAVRRGPAGAIGGRMLLRAPPNLRTVPNLLGNMAQQGQQRR